MSLDIYLAYSLRHFSLNDYLFVQNFQAANYIFKKALLNFVKFAESNKLLYFQNLVGL